MNNLEKLKAGTKIIALVGVVIVERKLVDILIPRDVASVRKLLVIAGTVIVADLTANVIFRQIDVGFDKIITDIGADIIGMEG